MRVKLLSYNNIDYCWPSPKCAVLAYMDSKNNRINLTREDTGEIYDFIPFQYNEQISYRDNVHIYKQQLQRENKDMNWLPISEWREKIDKI